LLDEKVKKAKDSGVVFFDINKKDPKLCQSIIIS